VRFDPGLPDESVNVSPTHPLREALLLVAGVVGAVVGLVLCAALAADLLVPKLPPDLEVRLFAAGWLPDVGAEEEPDPRTESVQSLVDRLAHHWPENPYGFQVVVFEAEDPNAFAFPGGWIALTTGLLDGADSENELAFVLGHEIGHFRRRDHLRGMGRGLALGLALSAFTASSAGGVANVGGLAAQLASRSFDRQQEVAADAFGMKLLAAEYGHVAGAAEFFEATAGSGDGFAERMAGYLSTHPLHEERIFALRELTGEHDWPARGELVPLPD
jgi:Zn-dependent protease with chaperone function